MDGTRRFSISLSPIWRVLFLATGLMSLMFMAGAFETGDPVTILMSVAFFGFGGTVVLKVMIRNSGSIEVRKDGVVLDCYLTTGLISWENLEAAQELKILGVSYLGLSTRDPQAYVQSRKQLPELKHEGDRALGQGFTRIMIGLLGAFSGARTGVNVVLSIFGFAPLPKTINEATLMEWNGESYGAQLIIHKMWLPEFDALLKELQNRVTAAPRVVPAELTPVNGRSLRHDPATESAQTPRLKACPMCAERVQPEARICRYCRYSFDAGQFLPASS